MICTIGPTSDKVDVLSAHLKNQMNVCRLNFSHDNHEVHSKKIDKVKEAIKMNPQNDDVAIMIDTKGPEIRTGYLQTKKIQLEAGQEIIVTTDYDIKGDSNKISVSYGDLATTVDVGSKILIADGNLSLEVKEVDRKGGEVKAVVLNDFLLGEKKNVNLPGAKITLPTITEKDEYDIVDFSSKNEVDMVALSFARSAECIRSCRALLGEKGKHIKIIPKIENQEGLENLEEILEVSDGVMIARGDLGMELEPSRVFLAQKYITQTAHKHRKPVIVATQMLESMTENSRPTRAEITDVGNAVFDLNDVIMLSGETGNGNFPIESTSTMTDIAREAERNCDYLTKFRNKDLKTENESEALGLAAVNLAYSSGSQLIICLSNEVELVEFVSFLKPDAHIIYPHQEGRVRRGLQLNYGVQTVGLEQSVFNNREALVQKCLDRANQLGIGNLSDTYVVVDGNRNELSIKNLTN